MKLNLILKYLIGALILLLVTVFYLSTGGAKIVFKKAYINVSNDNYIGDTIWPTTDKDKKIAGEAAGVAINKDGNILYLHRGSGNFNSKSKIPEDTLLIFDGKKNELINSWGKDIFIAPHGLSVDNEDNVWITDTELNKVFKFTMEGRLLKVFGGDYPFGLETALRIRNKLPKFPTLMNEKTFAKPTDIINFEDGSFCVSDGYRNSRIAMFDKDGNFLWERNKLGNGEEEFYLPHGISKDNENNIYVADRSNGRIQIFNRKGEFITAWNPPELCKPFGVEVKDDLVYVADGGDFLYGNTESPTSQIVIFNKKGEIVDRFSSWGSNEGQLEIPHDVTVDDKGNIYVADLKNQRLLVFVRR